MRGMTLVAGADGNRAMHEALLERFRVMTRNTKFRSVFTNVQQKFASGAVRFVTGEAVALFYRRMHYFLTAKGGVTLSAKNGYLDNQFPTLPPQ